MSWSYRVLHEMEIAGTKLLRRVFIDEVSILTPSTRPKEPLAKVCLVQRRASSPVAVVASEPAVAGGPLRQGRIYRRNVGQVLGVR